ncbi:MAG: hypothetical protein EOP51_04235 [Sphingobacteriales bacterium]|nr:MAG: hypothetical protein EOP51_04235 [Sphingobacteriales bacterium]
MKHIAAIVTVVCALSFAATSCSPVYNPGMDHGIRRQTYYRTAPPKKFVFAPKQQQAPANYVAVK